ncbi:hypothetical protein [Natrinema salifodinae]|uniref:Small CPxCG-related zinc finger protein n=1 Tax=Natrinema salifodinae TaxID=1202768 RepID=A0A1I0M3Y2_9EURY|nr:hypothetical protein [Natrinema salifodinae]SEV82490.1 hypothetical protein SAMN05216285_0363 [Natrinema salifodinae]
MSLSTFLSELFSDADSTTESPETATAEASEHGDEVPSVTVVHECRDCGTNVSVGTSQCPTCESEDIVSYSID